ncbi:MAG: hypothetical protein KDC24_10770 [Saprospiraceae bacterium]|nr:hypothetical protein [Saprospiraceae bacterium]
MKKNDIQSLITYFQQENGEDNVRLFETHSSWVILAGLFAYKVKKPVHYSFLDFSTLEKRKFYCERELELNRRFSPEIYKSVVPIYEVNGAPTLHEKGEVVAYALKMERLDNAFRMDVLAASNQIRTSQIDDLVNKLTDFHKKTARPSIDVPKEKLIADFDDLFHLQTKLEKFPPIQLESLKGFAQLFWDKVYSRWQKRQKEGFYIDGHGDLHTRNIFLYPDKAILFDCIEFNDHFRFQDILSELAFLSMDLEYWGLYDLSSYFLKRYNGAYKVIYTPEDEWLFLYYKMYRANIRLKVYALKELQAKEEIEELIKYWSLMMQYFKELQELISRPE